MKHFNGYGAYLLFLSLRTHFQSDSYDFFKGRYKASRETYLKRRDKSLFEKLAKRYDAEELKDFYIANIIEGNHYVIDMLSEKANNIYLDYKQTKQSLSYKFSAELDKAFFYGAKEAFSIKEGEYPPLLMLYLRREVSLPTLIMLNDFVGFDDKFSKYLGENDILWTTVYRNMRKLKPFLRYDKSKIHKILKEKIT